MQQSPEKTLIAFGYHNPEGSRHAAIKQGLQEHGYTLIECTTKKAGFLPKCRELTKKYRGIKTNADYVLLPFLGHYMIPLAWLLSRRQKRKIIFDAFISLYDTYVCDRALVHPRRPRALFLWLMDWLSCALADVVLLDTEEHKQYFVDSYGIAPKKILVVPIGSRTQEFNKAEKTRESKSFIVEFHGMFIPLQGIDTILRAAHILQQECEQIEFRIIGKGQTYPAMQKLAEELALRNVIFTGFKPLPEVAEEVQHADVCLGIFGVTEKADRVIPHKAYEVLASGKPLITGRTRSAKRYLHEEENVLLSAPGDAEELAEKIRELRKNSVLRQKIAKNGHQLFLERFQPKAIVLELTTWLAKSSSPE